MTVDVQGMLLEAFQSDEQSTQNWSGQGNQTVQLKQSIVMASIGVDTM